MTSDKAARDRTNNQKFQEFFPGIDFKVLRVTQETGHWTVLLKCAKGSGIPGTNT
jgi:hypothetical protein